MWLCATGDSILMNPLPAQYKRENALQARMLQADVRIGNMETTLSSYDQFASTFCGGTWLTAPPSVLEELAYYAFAHYGFANNHSMDYSYGGLNSTMEALRAKGLFYSGAGGDLEAATRHAAIPVGEECVGMITATSTCDDSARAGAPGQRIPPRPGINMLRHSEVYQINHRHMQQLQEIAAATCINGRLDNSKRGGYTPSMPGVFQLGPLLFAQGEPERKISRPHPQDMRRIAQAVRVARAQTAYVIVSLHSHEIKGATDDQPDYFVEEFSRACIDEGACAVICSGTHQIKGVEVYRGCPIFYSIGNFIFQSDQVAALPADYYEKYDVPLSYTAKEALAVRSKNGTRGLQTDISNYLALVPFLSLEQGRVKEVVIQPIELGFTLGPVLKGLPRVAHKDAAQRIYGQLCELSGVYGTRLHMENEQIVLDLP